MITTTTIHVRYAETDRMGIAHHSNYAVWFEAARTDLSRHLKMSYAQMEEAGLMLPLSELHCKYIGSCTYDDTLEVKCAVTQLSRVKITFSYKIYKDGKLITTGDTVHGITDTNLHLVNTQKKFPEIYRIFEEALEPEF